MNSTNSFAMELFRHGLADDGTVVYTDEQTEGRGQMQREWISEPYENLMFTIILKPVTNISSDPFLLNKCMTLAVLHIIRHLLPKKEVKIKWPNDIMVNNKKIAGILVENSFSGHQLNASIVGIGINVNQNFISSPAFNATSILDHRQEITDRPDLLKRLLETADHYYLKLIKGEKEFFESEFDQQLLGYGIENEFEVEGRRFSARILGCDNEGRLTLDSHNEIKNYLHGEIRQIIA